MNEIIDFDSFLAKVRTWWAASLGIIIALILGVLFGILYVESRILNDCKYISGFRIDSQSFNCSRKI